MAVLVFKKSQEICLSHFASLFLSFVGTWIFFLKLQVMSDEGQCTLLTCPAAQISSGPTAKRWPLISFYLTQWRLCSEFFIPVLLRQSPSHLNRFAWAKRVTKVPEAWYGDGRGFCVVDEFQKLCLLWSEKRGKRVDFVVTCITTESETTNSKCWF